MVHDLRDVLACWMSGIIGGVKEPTKAPKINLSWCVQVWYFGLGAVVLFFVIVVGGHGWDPLINFWRS